MKLCLACRSQIFEVQERYSCRSLKPPPPLPKLAPPNSTLLPQTNSRHNPPQLSPQTRPDLATKIFNSSNMPNLATIPLAVRPSYDTVTATLRTAPDDNATGGDAVTLATDQLSPQTRPDLAPKIFNSSNMPNLTVRPSYDIVTATLRTAPDDNAAAVHVNSGGHVRIGGGGGEGGDNDATPLSDGHARIGGSGAAGEDEGPRMQLFLYNCVVNVTQSGGIGGSGGAGLSVGGRGGDGGGASMLGVPPPPTRSYIPSTGDASPRTGLFGDGVTSEGLVIGVHAVQEQIITTRRLTPPPRPAYPTRTVDDASLGTVGGDGAPGEGTVIDVHAQTTTTRSIGICSTPLPLPAHPARIVDNAALGTVGQDGEMGIQAQITTTRSIGIHSIPPSSRAHRRRLNSLTAAILVRCFFEILTTMCFTSLLISPSFEPSDPSRQMFCFVLCLTLLRFSLR
ncbi:hypothetical protein C8J57DRAFT_377925 [Mycena rebaudengoi]|nr:hypothetical protein C8J57DRAFT_377925 [Mycena rebaudengoi]